MTLFAIQHPSKNPTVLSAAALIVHDGYLYATKYGGSFEAGKTECDATWAPGEWLSYEKALACPKCGQDVRQW